MTELVKVLMNRDDITEEEAEDRIAEVKRLFEECNYDIEECEDILANELGVELDYLFDII